MEPCYPADSWPMWTFVLFAVLSHARGTALLLREVLSWATRKRRARKNARVLRDL
jgi:hypothetical protein